MSVEYRLQDRLPVYPDESLAGLMMRYACFYNIDMPEQLLVRLGQGARRLAAYAALDPHSPDGEALGRFLNLTPETISVMSNWNADRNYRNVLGHKVLARLTACSTRQVCPECLADQPYHRAAWLLAAVPACPIHGCALIVSCPACGARLGWSGMHVHSCSACKADLRSRSHPSLSPEEVSSIQGVVGLFLSRQDHATGMAPGDALHAAYELGCTRAEVVCPGMGSAGTIARQRDALPRILDVGWGTLCPWPSAFHSFLEELTSRSAERKPKKGLARAFGPFAAKLHKYKEKGWAGPLASELADYAMCRPTLSIGSTHLRRRGSGQSDEIRSYSVSEAARLLGVSADTVRRTSSRIGLITGEVGHGTELKLRGADIRRLAGLQPAREDAIGMSAVAAILGVSWVTTRNLVAIGLLKKSPLTDRVKSRDAFLRSEVLDFLNVFERAAGEVEEVDDPSGTFRALGVSGRSDQFGVLRICSMVLAGNLKPVAFWKGHHGLQRFLFPRFLNPDSRRRVRRTDDRQGAGNVRAS